LIARKDLIAPRDPCQPDRSELSNAAHAHRHQWPIRAGTVRVWPASGRVARSRSPELADSNGAEHLPAHQWFVGGPSGDPQCLGTRTARDPRGARPPNPSVADRRDARGSRLPSSTRRFSTFARPEPRFRRSLARWNLNAPWTRTAVSSEPSTLSGARLVVVSSATRRLAWTASRSGFGTETAQIPPRSRVGSGASRTSGRPSSRDPLWGRCPGGRPAASRLPSRSNRHANGSSSPGSPGKI